MCGESGQPFLVPDFRGIALSFSPFNLMLAGGLLYIAFIILREGKAFHRGSSESVMSFGIEFEGHLGCFQVLAITNSAAMNIVEQMSLLYECTSFGYMPKSGIVGS
ncbi:zinc finger protein [Cricetulus griseus]|nr:zinc finger protein [Cricetulus griseus]